MNRTAIVWLCIFVVFVLCGVPTAQPYDPALFTVCPEWSNYGLCPSGDISWCFCISYDGEPLDAPPSDVYLRIECNKAQTYPHFICPNDTPDKALYLDYYYCFRTPGCGTLYCWGFQGGGYCDSATVSLHMVGDPVPFYQFTTRIYSLDVNADGLANQTDKDLIQAAIGTDQPWFDLNGNGIVDADDVWQDYLCAPGCMAHTGHSCEQLVGTQQSTWGEIKTIYR